MQKFLLSYLYTNLFAFSLFVILLIISLIIGIKHKNHWTTSKIAYCSTFIALAIVLNTLSVWISKETLPPKFEIRLGDIIVLFPGMLFGPFIGMISAVIVDTITLLTTANTGMYHFGFCFNLSLYGFLGGLITFKKNFKGYYLNIFFIHLIAILSTSLFFVRIWLPSAYNMSSFIFFKWELMVTEIIKLSIEIPIYSIILLSSAKFVYNISSVKFYNLWLTQNNKILEIN